MASSTAAQPREPSLLDAIIPIVTLVILLTLSVYLYRDNSSSGANQIALIMSAGVALIIGLKNGLRWKELEQGLAQGIAVSTTAILILLAVGSLIGTWIIGGTVPTLIYYGLEILHPKIFYAATCIVCAIVSLSIGSSWTTAGTVGVALVGVSHGLGLSPSITAGAIISGSYFGDKMSPLSDTTNLAPAVAGSDIFDHIRHMTWTTFPSLGIAIVMFGLAGFINQPVGHETTMQATLHTLDSHFTIAWYNLLPVAFIMGMAYKKMPAFPTILLAALLGGVFAVLFQTDVVIAYAANPKLPHWLALFSGIWKTLFDGYVAHTGNARVDELLSRGGMSSMLNTVWLIMCAMAYGAAMEKTGLLQRLVASALHAAKSTAALIITTLVTCIGTNIIASDQYMAIVLPGRTYRMEFRRRKLAPVNLSRALEDAGTLTSALVPWNSGGAYMAATLGVGTLHYLPFCFFNLLNPLIAATFAIMGFKIKALEEDSEDPIDELESRMAAETD